jgi:hypothetical protein
MRSMMLIMLAAATVVAGVNTEAQAKNPPGISPTHYQCYKVIERKPAFKPRGVKVKDQFGGAGVKVLKPVFLCVPAVKNDSRPRDTRTHYLCYEDRGLKTPERTVEIVNQFGKEIVVVATPTVLCVPSQKIPLKK